MLAKYLSLNIVLMFFNVVMNFLVLVFLSHIFVKADLVIYTFTADILKIFGLFFTGFKDAVVRVFSGSNEKPQVFKGMLVAAIVLWVIEALVVLPYLQFFYLPHHLENYHYPLYMLEFALAFVVWAQLIGYMLLANRAYKVVAVSDFVKSLLFIIFFVLVYSLWHFQYGNQYLLLAFMLGNGCFMVWMWQKARKIIPEYRLSLLFKSGFWKNKKEARQFYMFSFIATVEYMFAYFYIYVSSFIILSFFNPSELADFQVVARPIYMALINIFSFPVFRFLLPEYSKLVAESNVSAIFKYRQNFIKILSVLGVVAVLGCWVTSYFFIGVLFPKQYIDAVRMINILIVALPFVIYTASSFALIKAKGGFWHTLFTRVFGSVFFVIAFFVLYHVGLGVDSVMMAMVASAVIMFGYALMVELKYLKELRQL